MLSEHTEPAEPTTAKKVTFGDAMADSLGLTSEAERAAYQRAQELDTVFRLMSAGWHTGHYETDVYRFGAAVETACAAGLHIGLVYPINPGGLREEFPEKSTEKAPVFRPDCLSRAQMNSEEFRDVRGVNLFTDDPQRVFEMTFVFICKYGAILPNLAVHLHPSGLLLADYDTPAQTSAYRTALKVGHPEAHTLTPGPTVQTPGKFDGVAWRHSSAGHSYFVRPPDVAAISGPNSDKDAKNEKPAEWQVLGAPRQYALLPGSVRSEGAYRFTGSVGVARQWLVDHATKGGKRSVGGHTGTRKAYASGDGETPRHRWGREQTWADLLTEDGWTETGGAACGPECTQWRHPNASSARSGIAHGEGCTAGYTAGLDGAYPLHVWSSSCAPLDSGGTYTRFQYVTAVRYGGDSAACEKGERMGDYADPTAMAWVAKVGSSGVTASAGEEASEEVATHPDGSIPAAVPAAPVPVVPLADAQAVFRTWLGADYDLDALHAVLATAAVEQLTGDPLWLLLISGSGNAKTETAQALDGVGAKVVSTISSGGALLSATAKKEIGLSATGGLLREVGDRGTIVIKDVTSILSMNKDARAEVLAALREVYDGRWNRSVGTDGGRTLQWAGRVAVVGAVTTAWDRAHAVIASMGDRFVLLRMDSNLGRIGAGKRAIGNTGHEVAMREELAAVVRGVLAGVDPSKAITVTDAETDLLLAAADIVTRARTGVDFDYRGEVIDAHAPEMPTRFAKQLAQVVRGAVAIGMDRTDALRLAIRCARDSMPPLRLAILDDLAAHPNSSTTEVRKRIGKPRSTVDRQLQALYMLDLVEVDESDVDAAGRTVWRYTLADEIDATRSTRTASANERGRRIPAPGKLEQVCTPLNVDLWGGCKQWEPVGDS
ncbi:hypothetical protein ACIGO9_26720 [Nocardia asteroides]|uniref:hypothetical protein n=1 Tax=Nocardia asteroides TaxID=1824 RepID=UPI0037CA9938